MNQRFVIRISFVLATIILMLRVDVVWGGDKTLDSQIEDAWNIIWTNFYSEETHLFYDFLESIEPGKTLDHLPTKDEVEMLYPHPCGYGTGMEDCAISGGIILNALIDRYLTEFEMGSDAPVLNEIKLQAENVFIGLELLTTVSGSPGFVARGVSPKALGCCYINSSRDQVTHLVLSVWNYWRSPLISKAMRARAASVLFAIADRMTQNVTPDNDYDFLCADGTRCRIGISRMKNVEDHEAARLTAVYAVAWDVAKRSNNINKEEEYWNLWRDLANTTIIQSASIVDNEALLNRMPSYAYLQMQESLDVLLKLEPDKELKELLAKTLCFIGGRVSIRRTSALNRLKSCDLTATAPRWREVGGLNGEYRKIWYCPRECGEIALTIAYNSANESLDSDTLNFLEESLMTPDFNKITSCGVFHLLGAYEKARRLGGFRSTRFESGLEQ